MSFGSLVTFTSRSPSLPAGTPSNEGTISTNRSAVANVRAAQRVFPYSAYNLACAKGEERIQKVPIQMSCQNKFFGYLKAGRMQEVPPVATVAQLLTGQVMQELELTKICRMTHTL